jgi:hypothetical protein
MIGENRKPRSWEYAILAICIAMIGMARPPYGAFCLLLVQIGKPGRKAWFMAAMAGLAILIWCGLTAAFTMVPVGEADPSAQWQSLCAHPLKIFTIAYNTLLLSSTYAAEFIGRLGWNTDPLPAPYLVLAGAAVICAALATMSGAVLRPVYPALAVAFSIISIFVLQYFDWTPPGVNRVEGVVGRYFLPLAFVAALFLPPLRGFPRARHTLYRAAIIVLGAVTPAVVVQHLVFRFYVG